MGVANPTAKGMLLHNAWSLSQSSSPWASERVWQDSGGLHSVGTDHHHWSTHQRRVCVCDWVPSLGQATGCMATKVPLLGPLICRS